MPDLLVHGRQDSMGQRRSVPRLGLMRPSSRQRGTVAAAVRSASTRVPGFRSGSSQWCLSAASTADSASRLRASTGGRQTPNKALIFP